MNEAWRRIVEATLAELQDRITARDLPGLLELFEEPAVLIGTAGDGRTPDGRIHYLRAVVDQPAALHWEWDEFTPYFDSPEAVGVAAFGIAVFTEADAITRTPVRATIFIARSDTGWRFRELHLSASTASF